MLHPIWESVSIHRINFFTLGAIYYQIWKALTHNLTHSMVIDYHGVCLETISCILVLVVISVGICGQNHVCVAESASTS